MTQHGKAEPDMGTVEHFPVSELTRIVLDYYTREAQEELRRIVQAAREAEGKTEPGWLLDVQTREWRRVVREGPTQPKVAE